MNTTHPQEQEVLDRTLAEVRRVRRCRTMRKLVAFPLLLVAGVGWMALNRGTSPEAAPLAQVLPAVENTDESLTVVEWKGGTPSLVEYSGEELGKLELSFSLEPVVAFPEEAW